MNTTVGNLYRIQHDLARVPKDRLTEISDFIEFILLKSKIQKPKVIKLEGVWQGLGFDKIANLDDNIANMRKEVGKSLENRSAKWNI